GDVEWAYLRFAVGDVGNIAQAQLRFYVADGSVDSGKIWTISNTTWGERSITWNNKPAVDGMPVLNIGATTANTYVQTGKHAPHKKKRVQNPTSANFVDLDVTKFVAANQVLSLAIVPNSPDGFDFFSRESTAPPVLIITPVAPNTVPTAGAAVNPNCTL